MGQPRVTVGLEVCSGRSQHNKGHLLGAHLLPQAGVGVIPGWSLRYSSLWDLGSLISALPAPPHPHPSEQQQYPDTSQPWSRSPH